MSHYQLPAILSIFLLFLSSPFCHAEPGPVPEGNYNCHKISGSQLIHLGTLEIRGTTYRVDPANPFKAFTVDKSGAITFTAGISFLPTGWKLQGATYKGLNKAGKPMIVIRYQSGTGNNEVIDCVKE